MKGFVFEVLEKGMCGVIVQVVNGFVCIGVFVWVLLLCHCCFVDWWTDGEK